MTGDIHCRSCRAVVTLAQRFCTACGELYPSEPADQAMARAGPLQDLLPEIRPLLQEKARLGETLDTLARKSAEQALSTDERREWELAYQRWRDVAFEVTLAVDGVHPRAESDRRRTSQPPPPDGPARGPDDRRDPFWHRAP